jgi:lysozyme
LANDIRKWVAVAGQWDWFDQLTWARQGVIVCMLHQLGAKGVANFKKMIAALSKYDYDTAASEMLDSYGTVEKPGWHRQTPKRCELMAQIMRTGEWE